MRKILFLDIDGVLNSASWFKRRNKEQRFSGLNELDIELMHLFDEIVEKTGCFVVLSSTWRLSKHYREDLERQGLNTNFIIDRTPHMPRPSGTGVEYGERGKEIRAWLENNPDVTQYAIVDDDSDMLPEQSQSFFQTSWENGLTREIADKIINHLSTASCIVLYSTSCAIIT